MRLQINVLGIRNRAVCSFKWPVCSWSVFMSVHNRPCSRGVAKPPLSGRGPIWQPGDPPGPPNSIAPCRGPPNPPLPRRYPFGKPLLGSYMLGNLGTPLARQTRPPNQNPCLARRRAGSALAQRVVFSRVWQPWHPPGPPKTDKKCPCATRCFQSGLATPAPAWPATPD